MKKVVLTLAAILVATSAVAASKSYQVTGPVLEVTDKTVTIQKGSEKWEIARDASTKLTGDLKVGAKATVQYTISAADITVKGGDKKAAAPAKTDAKKK